MLTRDTAAKLLGEFGNEVVIDAVLERSQNDDGPRVRHLNLLHRFVRKDRFLFYKANQVNQLLRSRLIPINLLRLVESLSDGVMAAADIQREIKMRNQV